MNLQQFIDDNDILDVNGQLYAAGWDEAGYFSVVMVEENPFFEEEPDSGPQFMPHAEAKHGYGSVNLDPPAAEVVAELIRERV